MKLLFDWIDAVSKVFAVAAVVGSAIYFFVDRYQQERLVRTERSVQILDEFYAEDLRLARRELDRFWELHGGYAKASNTNPIPVPIYARFISRKLTTQAILIEALLKHDAFHAQALNCIETELCEKSVLLRSTCQHLDLFSKAYLAGLEVYAKKINSPTIGLGTRSLQLQCTDFKREESSGTK